MSWKDRAKKVAVNTSSGSWKDRATKVAPEVSGIESGARGLAQGVTLGFSDEITGAIESAAGSLGLVEDKTYEQARDEARANNKAAREANPMSYGAGEITGAVGTVFVPGLGAATGAKLATVAGKAALQGSIAGLGGSEEESLSGQALDTIKGAGIGAAGGAAGYGLGKAAQRLLSSKAVTNGVTRAADKLDESAERMAASSLGAERATVKKFGQDKIREAGRYALDEGIISDGLKTAKNPINLIAGSDATEEMLSKTDALKKLAMSTRKEAYNTIDEAGAGMFKPADVAAAVDNELGTFNKLSPLNKGQLRQLNNTLDAIKLRGSDKISMAEAQNLIEELGAASKFDTNRSTGANDIAKKAYHIVRRAVNDAASSGSDNVSLVGLKETIEQSNKSYGSAKTVEELLNNRLAREQGNKFIGLTDSIAGGAGYVAAGPGGLALVGAKKATERYGKQLVAITADNLADVLRSTPERLGKYAPVLQKSSERGAQALAVSSYLLMQQDPEYRKLMMGRSEDVEE